MPDHNPTPGHQRQAPVAAHSSDINDILAWVRADMDPHPIAPPGATLHPNSNIAPKSVGKVPSVLVEGTETWAGLHWQRPRAERLRLQKSDLWAVSWAQGNGGIRSDRHPAIDIDCYDPPLAEELEALALRECGPGPIRIGQAPKRLIMYAAASGGLVQPTRVFRFTKPGEKPLGVEILAAGRQYVVKGDHPATLTKYMWDCNPLDVAENGMLSVLTAEKVRAFIDAMKALLAERGWTPQGVSNSGGGQRAMGVEAPPAASLRAHDMGVLASAVAAIPNSPDTPREDYISLGLALKAAAGADREMEGFLLWMDWADRWQPEDPARANTQEVLEADWARLRPPYYLGADYVYNLAAEAGWSRLPVVRHDFEADPIPRAALLALEREVASAAALEEWPEPLDFLGDSAITGAPQLRHDHLPAALGGFTLDTAQRMGVDPAAVALAAVVSCASVASDEWKLQPKAHDDTWTENPRLWGAIVGDPSILKSPVIKAATRPVDALDASARERYAENMRRHRATVAALKAEKAPPSAEPPPPRLDRYLIEGTTVEALTEVLRDDDDAKQRAPSGKLLVRQDELSEWLAGLDGYRPGGKGGADRGAYLRLYNGGRHVVDRIGRGAFAVPNWSACVLGGIQPEPIQRIAKDAADDGLLQRFLFCVPAGQGDGEDRRPDHAALGRYAALFPALAALRPWTCGGNPAGAVVLHPAAHEYREAINTLVKALAASPETSPRMRAALGKWHGVFARLALTFHLVEIAGARVRGEPEPEADILPPETARRAASYMREVLLPHLLRADGLLFLTPQTGHARWIAGFILASQEAQETGRVSLRDIQRNYGALRAPERRRELVEVLTGLEVMGWLRPDGNGAPTKAPTNWRVNPRLHSTFAVAASEERRRRDAARQAASDAMRRYRRENPR